MSESPEIASIDLSQMRQLTRSPEEKMRKKERGEHLFFRNQKILTDLATGVTKDTIQEEYNLSRSQLNRIISEAKEESEDWYKNLARSHMIQLFRSGSTEILEVLKRMKKVCQDKQDDDDELEALQIYNSAYTSFIRLIADGPALTKIKEELERYEKYANIHFKKQK